MNSAATITLCIRLRLRLHNDGTKSTRPSERVCRNGSVADWIFEVLGGIGSRVRQAQTQNATRAANSRDRRTRTFLFTKKHAMGRSEAHRNHLHDGDANFRTNHQKYGKCENRWKYDCNERQITCRLFAIQPQWCESPENFDPIRGNTAPKICHCFADHDGCVVSNV